MGETTIRIIRPDGSLLLIEGIGLSRAFFAQSGSRFDDLAGRTKPNKIEASDINFLNQVMQARTPPERWESLVGQPLRWLAAIRRDLDLIETSDAEWEAADGERLVRDALAALVGEGRGPAVATKMLHLKRPLLFPILDRLVVEVLGAHISSSAAPPAIRTTQVAAVMMRLREQGRANVSALHEIQRRLRAEGSERSLLRILDSVLWSSHSAAGGPSVSGRVIECRLANVDEVFVR